MTDVIPLGAERVAHGLDRAVDHGVEVRLLHGEHAQPRHRPLLPRPLYHRLLGALAGGHVARDPGETDPRFALVPDRAQDHARPEAGAVLPHPPVLLLEAALPLGDLQLPLGLAGADLRLGIEPGEALADDLAGRVPLQALGEIARDLHESA